jgi:RNA polymerase sigma-70 factor (ECF subfamily)
MIRAISSIGAFEPVGTDPFHKWLVAMSRCVLADRLRKLRSLKRGGNLRIEVPGGSADSVARLLEELSVYSRTPSNSAASHELMAYIRRTIERLSADHREVLNLRYMSGLDVKETAQKMGRTEPAVVMLTSRALKSLREQLRSLSLYI